MSKNPDDTSQTARLFRCPSCGSALEVVDALAVTCQYCGNSVPVPAKYRPQKPPPQQAPPQVIIQTPVYSEQHTPVVRRSPLSGCILTVIILLFVGGIVVVSLLGTGLIAQNVPDGVGIDVGPIGEALATFAFGDALGIATAAPAFAEVLLEFGGEGSGAGLFDDSRYIAVDPDGNIFVADYGDGRVQKFDPAGKFELLINVEPDRNGNNYIQGLAADYAGNIYAARGGDILKYSGEGGELIATIPGHFADLIYEDVAVDAANNLYAMHAAAGEDDLLKLSPDGEILQRWRSIVSGVNKDDPAIGLDMTVDGAGHPYIVSSFAETVYIYDADGNYVDRFGEPGTEPGQLSSPNAIAVDGKNRVYVSQIGRIDVFDTGGRYLGQLPLDYTKGAPFGIAIGLDGSIYAVTTQGKVLKFRLNDSR